MGVAVQNLNEDTLGSHLKAGIAQFVALEFSRAGGRDNRILNRYLPWLYHPPSAMQQGLAVCCMLVLLHSFECSSVYNGQFHIGILS